MAIALLFGVRSSALSSSTNVIVVVQLFPDDHYRALRYANLVDGRQLRRWQDPAVGPEEGEHVVILIGAAHSTNMLIEAIPCVNCRLVSGCRVAEHAEQKRVRLGCIPVLPVVDDGIEEQVKLMAGEAAGERRNKSV